MTLFKELFNKKFSLSKNRKFLVKLTRRISLYHNFAYSTQQPSNCTTQSYSLSVHRSRYLQKSLAKTQETRSQQPINTSRSSSAPSTNAPSCFLSPQPVANFQQFTMARLAIDAESSNKQFVHLHSCKMHPRPVEGNAIRRDLCIYVRVTRAVSRTRVLPSARR